MDALPLTTPTKQDKGIATAPETHSESQLVDSWGAEEERRLVWKVDCIVLILLTWCFFNFQLDCANTGNALTDGFLDDVGISQDWFNVG
ncbi:hypothetical protein BJX99DRAFT_219688 [Aspergillus californicus]